MELYSQSEGEKPMLPIDTYLIRHGQSGGNAVIHLAKHGDDSGFTDEFLRQHSSQWRLTNRGILQAQVTGEWLRKNTNTKFDRYFVSDYLRTKETAALLELPNARWQDEFLLRERKFGEIDFASGAYKKDSFLKADESNIDVCMRVDHIIQKLYRECEKERVIIVSHGGVMWAFRTQLEQMSEEQRQELEYSSDPRDRMNNGQILHYTRRDPATNIITPHLWMRSICPNKPEWSRPEWKQVIPKTHTNEELLADVAKYPRICEIEY